MSRVDGRAPHDLRPMKFQRNYLHHAEGSCLVQFGATHVLCAATVEERVPLCGRYRAFTVCGMGPPSSGAVAIQQILGVLEARAIITRQREGKESWVSLAPSGTAPATPHQNPPTPSSAHLGKTVFALRKAA